jgi:hypothetical protein
MCRGAKKCTELGTISALWDRNAPLPPPNWCKEQLSIFEKALLVFINGDRDTCIDILSKIRSKEMQNWFIEHGQMSGFHRVRILNAPIPQPVNENFRDALRAPRKYELQVFSRDGYRCRYCGIKLVSNQLLTLFEKSLNSSTFRKGSTNLDRHGIFHIFKPVAD